MEFLKLMCHRHVEDSSPSCDGMNNRLQHSLDLFRADGRRVEPERTNVSRSVTGLIHVGLRERRFGKKPRYEKDLDFDFAVDSDSLNDSDSDSDHGPYVTPIISMEWGNEDQILISQDESGALGKAHRVCGYDASIEAINWLERATSTAFM